MKTHLKMLWLFTVLTEVLMKSGDVYIGTEGGEVEIRCSYPDDHIFTPKYFCREPCKNVLIKSEKNDQVFTTGRYSLFNSVNRRFFTVTIRKLKLTDSGVYYCGIDQWLRDTLKKVHLSVTPAFTFAAAPVSRLSHTTENTLITSNTFTTALISAESVQEQRAVVPVVCAGVLSLLGCWILVAFVILDNRRLNATSKSLKPHTTENTDLPDLKTVDDARFLSEEMTVVVYSLADPPKRDFTLNYSTAVHYCEHTAQQQTIF